MYGWPQSLPAAGDAVCYHRAMPSPRRFPPPWSIEERQESLQIHHSMMHLFPVPALEFGQQNVTQSPRLVSQKCYPMKIILNVAEGAPCRIFCKLLTVVLCRHG